MAALPLGKDTQPEYRRVVGWRHVHVLMLLFAISMAYILKINLSICIVEMTNKSSQSGYPIYPWSETEKNTVLSAIFWGYFVTQVPGGMLAQRYGPKWFMLLGLVTNGVLNGLTPLAARLGGWPLVCGVRVLQGLTQGFVYPSAHTMLSRWVPPIERGRWSTIVYSGKALGTIVSMSTTGLLAGSSFGWPSGFYVPAILTAVWSVLWIVLISDEPATSRFVSAEERRFIEDSLGDDSSGKEEKYSTPWLAIFSSVPMWAIIINHCGQNFGGWVLLSKMPAYMTDVLGFNIATGGINSALPYVCSMLLSLVVSWLAPIFTKKYSVAFSRKFFNSMAMLGAGVSLLVLAFINPSESVAILLLTLAGGFEAGTFAGYLVNHIDLAPNFGGPMMGITNGIATIVAILVPILVGLITGEADEQPKEETVRRWNIVFLLCAAVFFVCDLIFIIFGKATVQAWNTPKEKTNKSEELSKNENELNLERTSL